HGARRLDRANAAGDAEGDVDGARDALHPADVDGPPLGAGRDVVEHELVGALAGVAGREVDDVTHVAVVAEAGALDHPPVAHVQAGDDPAGERHTASSRTASATVRRPSRIALPSTIPP